MMKRRIAFVKEYFVDFLSFRWLLLAIVYYIYGRMLTLKVVNLSKDVGLSFNNWDVTFTLLTDMYLIVYFIIPIVLFTSIKTILKELNYLVLIRLGSYQKWIFHSLKKFLLEVFPFILIWLFISLFIVIGAPISNGWSEFSFNDNIANSLYEVNDKFDSPFAMLGAHLVLLLLAISVIYILFATVYLITKNKALLISLSTVFFIFNIVSFKLLPEKYYFLSPSSYLSITKATVVYNSPIWCYIVVLIIGIILLMHVSSPFVIKGTNYKSILKRFIPIGLYLLLCSVAVIYETISLESRETSTIWDVLIMSFRGSNSESFSYVPFFSYSIIYFGFIYFIQLYFNREIKDFLYYKIIRYKSINKWFWNWMKKMFLTVILFLIALNGIVLLIAGCFGMSINLDITVLPNSLSEVLYHFFINGFLQIIFYIFIIYIISWLTKETFYGTLVISCFMVLMLPGLNPAGILPVGSNSISYITEYSAIRQSIILVSANTITYSVIYILNKQSVKI